MREKVKEKESQGEEREKERKHFVHDTFFALEEIGKMESDAALTCVETSVVLVYVVPDIPCA